MLENLDSAWQEFLKDFLNLQAFTKICKNYEQANDLAIKNNTRVFPESSLIFQALNLTPPHKVRAVLLGQDPYHSVFGINNTPYAMGLSFSVPKNAPLPPSLRNIFKELESNLGIKQTSGDLSNWANNGVLLLNSILSVEQGKPKSHSHIGWEIFTDFIIQKLAKTNKDCVFILLGKVAQLKIPLIMESSLDSSRVISAPHPSPLSRGFINSGVFKKLDPNLFKS